MNRHVVLLGDSIFDNGAYVPGEPSVIEQLQAALPSGACATLVAVDGDVTASVKDQIPRIPRTATHLCVSVGGNDALGFSHVTRSGSMTAADVFSQLADIQRGFRSDYRDMVQLMVGRGEATAVCTIYDAVPGLDPGSAAALSIFNDVIICEAASAGLPVIDLRRICTEHEDYSAVSPIEPSSAGGQKIAAAIARVVTSHDYALANAVIY